MTQLPLFDTTPVPPALDALWQAKVARFEELIDLDLDRKATKDELLELAALRKEGVRGK